VRTLKIIFHLAQKYHISLPITTLLYRVVYEKFDLNKAIDILMSVSNTPDVDFDIVKE
jgi:glycerol-3-phosphate dehydrogenase (NAD(P)+)